MQLILAALLSASVRTVVAPRAPEAELRLRCPAGVVTRLVLPEPLRDVRLSAEARVALGVSIESSRPLAVLRLMPPSHPAQARLEFRGPERTLRLLIETSARGPSGELRVVLAAPAADARVVPRVEPTSAGTPEPMQAVAAAPAEPLPEPVSTATPTPTPAPTPTPVPTATPTQPPPSVAFEMSDLMRAAPVPIGRREGLPGQLPLVLVDALKGERFVWLRFTLEGGAARRVEHASWQRGAIGAFTQEPVGKDLRIVVQLPRSEVDKRARLQIELDSGASYRVSLNASTLAGFLKTLFQ